MRDPGLRDRGVEVRVGAFLILAAAVIVAGLFWISGSPFRGPTIRVWGVATNANRIATSSPVLLRGVEVGTVDEVALEADRVVLAMTLSARVQLPADTRGAIQPDGFLGQQLVELQPGTSARTLAEGDTLDLDRRSDLTSLASTLGDDVGSLIDEMEAMLAGGLAENVTTGSEAFTLAMQELAGILETERASIGNLLANMDTLTDRLAGLTGSEEVERTLANLDTLSTRLAAASEDFAATGRSLAAVAGSLEEGEGTLGKLLRDDSAHTALIETLETLRAAGEELAMLVRDVRERPDRYLTDLKISVF